MNPAEFNALTRRASLSRLGMASLAALAVPIAAEGKRKNQKKGDVNKRCKKQVGQCFDFFAQACEGNPDCQAILDRCCPSLGTCDFLGFFTCVQEGQATMKERSGLRLIP